MSPEARERWVAIKWRAEAAAYRLTATFAVGRRERERALRMAAYFDREAALLERQAFINYGRWGQR